MSGTEVMHELLLEKLLTTGGVFVGIVLLLLVLLVIYRKVGRK